MNYITRDIFQYIFSENYWTAKVLSLTCRKFRKWMSEFQELHPRKNIIGECYKIHRLVWSTHGWTYEYMINVPYFIHSQEQRNVISRVPGYTESFTVRKEFNWRISPVYKYSTDGVYEIWDSGIRRVHRYPEDPCDIKAYIDNGEYSIMIYFELPFNINIIHVRDMLLEYFGITHIMDIIPCFYNLIDIYRNVKYTRKETDPISIPLIWKEKEISLCIKHLSIRRNGILDGPYIDVETTSYIWVTYQYVTEIGMRCNGHKCGMIYRFYENTAHGRIKYTLYNISMYTPKYIQPIYHIYNGYHITSGEYNDKKIQHLRWSEYENSSILYGEFKGYNRDPEFPLLLDTLGDNFPATVLNHYIKNTIPIRKWLNKSRDNIVYRYKDVSFPAHKTSLVNKNGLWIIFHGKGNIKTICHYKSNLMHGIYQMYNRNGKLLEYRHMVYGCTMNVWIHKGKIIRPLINKHHIWID